MTTSIQLAPETERRLDILAASMGRTKAQCLDDIIAHGLADMEAYYLASNVLERVRTGREAVYSAADVRQELGLDDSLHRDGQDPAAETRQADCPSPLGSYGSTGCRTQQSS